MKITRRQLRKLIKEELSTARADLLTEDDFSKAFRAARDSGAETFMWNGEEYTTNTWEEDLPRTPSGKPWKSTEPVDSEGYLLPKWGNPRSEELCGGGPGEFVPASQLTVYYDKDMHDLKLRAGCHQQRTLERWLEGLE